MSKEGNYEVRYGSAGNAMVTRADIAQIEQEAYNRGRIEILEHVRAHVADVADETGVYIRADGLLIWLEGMIAEFEGDN